MLQARPDAEAREIFKRIRGGMDAESILRHIQEGDVLLQLALVPETTVLLRISVHQGDAGVLTAAG